MKELLLYPIQILFHPIDCCYLVKRQRKSIPIWYSFIILALTAVLRVVAVYTTHYPLNTTLPEQSNVFVLLGVLLLPGISWIVASYSTTTLMNGEASFREVLTLGSLCYIPYIITTPVKLIVSHLFSGESTGFYVAFGIAVTVWMIILQFVCFMVANDYGFLKALTVAAISIIVALLIWAFIILIFVFVAQFVIFIEEIILEIRSQMFR